MSDYPSAEKLMAEARKIPKLALDKLCEEVEQREEEMKQRNPHTQVYSAAQLREWKQSAEATQIYAWIPGAFEPFAKPDLDQLETLTESMRKAQQSFDGGGLSVLDTAKQHFGDGGWDGALAANFVNNFLTPLTGNNSIPGNQQKIADMLVRNMETTKALYGAARSDAYKLAKQTLVALEACGDCKGSDIGLALAVTGAVISVAGVALAPVTGGMSVAAGTGINVGIEVVKGVFAVGDKFTPEDGDTPLGADTVSGVVKNLAAALVELSTNLGHEEDTVIKALNTNYQRLTALRARANQDGLSSLIMPLKPKLTTAGTDLTGLD